MCARWCLRWKFPCCSISPHTRIVFDSAIAPEEVARVVPPPDGGETTVAMLSDAWFPDLESMQRTDGSRAGEHARASVAALRRITAVDIHVSVVDPSHSAGVKQGSHTVHA